MLDVYTERLDVVQLMGIAKLGEQGLPFDERVIRRVQILRQRLPNLAIAVDGGVNLDNAPTLIAAGATRLVVGSALWRAKDLPKALKQWQQLLAKSS